MSDGKNSIAQNRSKLKEFLASIATIRGDLSNITAPPFVLDTKSVVELPAYWAEKPSVFVAPASSNDPARRALLVLRWFVSALRNQQYAGHSEEEGVKKPLNAFLGELFLASWEDECGTTKLVSEQVSHHPPVTACRVWNEKHGVYAEGYTRQQITFTGSVNIQQTGHATLYIAKYDETYLIPLPNVKVKGIISGTPYPEIQGRYYIPSTNGYTSSIDFSGTGLFSSANKHTFKAKMYRDGAEDHPLYTVEGNWNTKFTIHDTKAKEDIETFDIDTAKPTEIKTQPLSEQDPWETRQAWKHVRTALERGNMQAVSDAKTKLEQGQRDMRKQEERDGKRWEGTFYRTVDRDDLASELSAKIGVESKPEDTAGLWKFDLEKWDRGVKKPYHENIRPDNTQDKGQGQGVVGKREAQKIESDKVVEKPETNEVAKNGTASTINADDTEAVIHPVMSSEDQQRDVEESKQLESGIDGMSLKEKKIVEDMLRGQHASG